jgi:GntR family transcriptional repressor for pyruvate dehydrogenase complex
MNPEGIVDDVTAMGYSDVLEEPVELRPVSRLALSEHVARELLRFIDMHPVLPGESLPSQSELAARFAVSRPTVREALRSLAATGVVRITNGKRAVVQPLSTDPLRIFFERAIGIDASAVREVMELRRGIEVEAAQLAAMRRTDEDLRRLDDVMDKMRSTLEAPSAYRELDLVFHVEIAAAAHNLVLYHLMLSMRETVLKSIREGFQRLKQESQLRTQELHEQVLAAVVAKDVEGARLAMLEHFAVPLTDLGEQDSQREFPARAPHGAHS